MSTYYDTLQRASLKDTKSNDSTCVTKAGEYSQKYNQLKTAYDTNVASDCYPNNVRYAEQIDEVRRTLADKQAQFDLQEAKFNTYMDTLDTVQTAAGSYTAVMTDLLAQEAALKKEHIALQQKIRAGRRRFLDSEPQAGVFSVLGLKTTDDKILLGFWVCFTVAILIVQIALMRQNASVLQFLPPQQKILILLAGLALSVGIAHFFIRTYG